MKNLITYVLLLIVTTLIFAFVINTYYISLLQATTKQNYKQNLQNISTALDTIILEVGMSSRMFFQIEEVKTLTNLKRQLDKREYYQLKKIQQLLESFRATKNYLNNIYITNEATGIVVSSNGTGTINEFFSKIHEYGDDSVNRVLNNISGSINERFTVVEQTYIIDNTKGLIDTVIPVILYTIRYGDKFNAIIADIDFNYVNNLMEENKLTNNSMIFIFNRSNNDIIASKSTLSNIELINLIVNKNFNTSKGILKYNKKSYHIIKNLNSNNNLEYYAIVPYQDFVIQSIRSLLLPILITGIIVIILFIAVYLFSKKVYIPVSHTITANQKMTDDLSLAMPYVCERYLLSIFNDNNDFPNDIVTNFLDGYEFSFKHKYFTVVNMNFYFTNIFYEKYSNIDHKNIFIKLIKILKELYSEIDSTYVLSIGDNQVCIIVNTLQDDIQDRIYQKTKQFYKTIEYDNDLIFIHCGIGETLENIVGLKNSYNQAVTTCSKLAYLSETEIKTYDKNEGKSNIHYTVQQESKIVNYLESGDKDNVKQFMEEIILKNINMQVCDNSLKELYVQLYSTGVRVLNSKNAILYDLLGEEYIELSSSLVNMSSEKIFNYVMYVFCKIIDFNNEQNEKQNITYLKQYLDDNYCNNIYLDGIAEHFNMSPKYMSRLIKQTLGVSYQEYISDLRINKSKELLVNTKKSIETIAYEIGFNSRYPFIRKFKILEGIAPSEYRKISQLKKASE